MSNRMDRDWTFKSREARRLFKELDQLDGRDHLDRAKRKSLKRKALAAKAESELVFASWENSEHSRDYHLG